MVHFFSFSGSGWPSSAPFLLVHLFRGYAVFKSKIIIGALVPFFIFNTAFAANVVDAKKDTRRMSALRLVTPNDSANKKAAKAKESTPSQVRNNSLNNHK